MEAYSLTVGREDGGKRLDVFLVERLPAKVSRSFIQKLIKSKNVFIGGRACKPHRGVVRGEVVEVKIPSPERSGLRGENIPLDIVYEDDHLLVVNKPAGMVVHPAPGNYAGTLVNALLYHCAELSGAGGAFRPGIVHRIDKGTSGLLVVAKDDRTHGGLASQFKKREIKRKYVALVRGVVELDNATIDLPIGRSGRDRKKMGVRFTRSKSATTRYKVLKRFGNFTLLELELGTGRTHQIRVHLSHLGHPILGDDKYGTRGELKRPALHAKTLGFVHPITKKRMEFDSEIPGDMEEFLKRHERHDDKAG
jgi:23S rRNA pseudouridine1911/1915/1917 synthase